MNSCAIVIPVYNEEDAIGSTVERLQKIISQIQNWKFEIVCVNDGSSDRTGDVLNQIGGITLLTHQINRGYGAALKTGLSHVSTRWVFICDADAEEEQTANQYKEEGKAAEEGQSETVYKPGECEGGNDAQESSDYGSG